uniref:Putative RNA-binding protein C365.04c n=1 Tax=Lygus hesperus TaxID=30085 RepID=A0A0A9ZBI5_LYGHE
MQGSDNSDKGSDNEFDQIRMTDGVAKEVPPREQKVGKKKKKARFILFVGNLPYNYTEEEIRNIFPGIAIHSVRRPTPKSTSRGESKDAPSRGFAFLEFENSLNLQRALRFHHTLVEGRKINIELTAGGGGNSKIRLKKLSERRKRLDIERQKIATQSSSRK